MNDESFDQLRIKRERGAGARQRRVNTPGQQISVAGRQTKSGVSFVRELRHCVGHVIRLTTLVASRRYQLLAPDFAGHSRDGAPRSLFPNKTTSNAVAGSFSTGC
jgi:hypothetical protein